MRICYFTLTTSTPTRDIVYLNGLRNLGVEIVECRDFSPGIKKFWQLWKKHRALHGKYDVLFVGFSGHILVPFARLISRKKIVFNALSSLYDGIILSRKKYGFLGLRVIYVWLIDWLAFNSADLTLVDTGARKEFIMRKFRIPGRKLIRLWSGVDETVFKHNPNIKKLPVFTVLFRGALMPEAGIEYLIQAASILQSEPIRFRIIGSGFNAPLVAEMLKKLDLQNVEWINQRLPAEELVAKMQECHISLGQLSDHKRQHFHVPFKTFENMALKIPQLITRNSYGILEFLTDNESCFCVNPVDAQDLAKKILWLRNNPAESECIAENAYKIFQRDFTSKVLAQELKNILSSL